jgi:hypothetical protein
MTKRTRFQSRTVRAAIRLVRLQRAGVITGPQLNHYLDELATMESQQGPCPGFRLRQVAARYEVRGAAGVNVGSALSRTSRVRMRLTPLERLTVAE